MRRSPYLWTVNSSEHSLDYDIKHLAGGISLARIPTRVQLYSTPDFVSLMSLQSFDSETLSSFCRFCCLAERLAGRQQATSEAASRVGKEFALVGGSSYHAVETVVGGSYHAVVHGTKR